MELIDFHTHRPTAEGVVSPRSFGIHPWDADREEAQSYEEFEKRHQSGFDQAEIIGECGLDKVCGTTWGKQMQLFEWQVRIAAKSGKPVVIHCVRAFNEMMELRRQNSGNTWVVHGFTGSLQLAEQLFRSDIWVSFGAAILDERRTKARECLRDIRSPFMLETDDSTCGIEAVYNAAAEIRKTTLAELCHTIKENYNTLMHYNI